jgi:asparagine synthase (glutamine-hydrolysing)
MGHSIFHRGPDQNAEWIDSEAGIGLASRRLAIIDLSEAGHQPMHSASGRFVLSYNGEIYNHRDLRLELEQAGKAPEWRGSSDTETLLAGFEAWGLAATLRRAAGMFALALWDRRERRLHLARDRIGEKPMYYGRQGRGRDSAFLFGSELKALACHPAFEGEIDRDALSGFMHGGYVPGPRSIYRNIFKLTPGCILTLDGSGEPRVEPYWSLAEVIRQGTLKPDLLREEEVVDELESVLGRAVAGQLIGDVPLGAFLSGGIDSSMIVALMQRASSVPVQTFTIGFDDRRFDEAPYAREVARHLGTDHHELTISAEDALAVIPKLPSIYDEPFADSSQIPTYLISQLARRRVTVALSGDGGDELFAGYDHYLLAARIWRHIRKIPKPVRSASGAILGSIPPGVWDGLARVANIQRRHSTFSDQVGRGARLLGAGSPVEVRQGITQRWQGDAVVIGANRIGDKPAHDLGPVESLMALDLENYLPDDVLVKVDRAAMAVSLETRAPYLDHRVVEFAWRLPVDFKMRGDKTKWLLRRLLQRYVPEHLFERPKRGFSVPIDEWLRGPLRDWAEELLAPGRLGNEGYFRADAIRAAWDAHLSGRSNRQAQIWTILMFQAWLEAERTARPSAGARSALERVSEMNGAAA